MEAGNCWSKWFNRDLFYTGVGLQNLITWRAISRRTIKCPKISKHLKRIASDVGVNFVKWQRHRQGLGSQSFLSIHTYFNNYTEKKKKRLNYIGIISLSFSIMNTWNSRFVILRSFYRRRKTFKAINSAKAHGVPHSLTQIFVSCVFNR